jgi:co-chaperonin GroES (HSP10)
MLGEKKDFEAFGDYVLVKQLPRGYTDGGIALPDGADNSTPLGEVVRVGPGAYNEQGTRNVPDATEGDVVHLVFNEYNAPAPVEIDGDQYIVVRNRDIFGRVFNKKDATDIIPMIAA